MKTTSNPSHKFQTKLSTRVGRGLLAGLMTLSSSGLLIFGNQKPSKAATYTYNNTTSGVINDVTTSCATPLTRTFTVGDSFIVEDVNLGFNADHTYRGDIRVTLKHPDGTSIQVISSVNDSLDNYDLLLDDSSSDSINDIDNDNTASPLYDRNAAPSNSLANFNGKQANGTWTLEICDTFAGDDGTFNSAQLILDDTAPPFDPSAATGPRPFELRYQTETTGNIEATGNAVLTCDTSLSACNSALSSGTAGNNNGGLAMEMLDIDGDSSTFNSSSADLNIPANSTILFAGLYWGGTSDGATTAAPDASKRNEVLLATPGGGYQTITAETFTSIDNSGTTGWDVYNSFTDVTSIVQSSGSGTYTVANVQASTGTGFTYPNAGWGLVVVYENANETRRNLTVYDGYQFTGFGSSINSTLTGIRTPPTSGFDVFLGAIAGDGEVDQTGDYLALNGTKISDTLNPDNNFFNGTISKFGSHVSNRNPNDPYNLVIDIDYLDLTSWNQTNNAIPTNATSVNISLGTEGDGIWPMVYFMGVEVFEPDLITEFQKSTPSSSYSNGDIVPYTITVKNVGQDNSTNTIISDAIPTGSTYAPGSLKINGESKSDADLDDEAEFDSSNVIFRVGTGADSKQGGTLNVGETVTVEFSVTVNAAEGEKVCNQASINYIGETSNNPKSGVSDDPSTTDTFGDCTEITVAAATRDYGDAPDSYGTDSTDDSGEGIGPSHTITSGIHLGTAPDAEDDAATPLDGSGDGAEDDGITLPPLLSTNTGYAIPTGNISATGTGTLHAWIDFNNNDVFDVDEYQSVAINSGIPDNSLIWTDISVNDTPDSTIYARFRFTSDNSINVNTPGGAASDGEVEDYQLTIDSENTNQTIDETPSNTSCSVQGGTLGNTNLFTPLDNGTMGFEDGSPDQSPSINPYPGVVTGGNFVQYTSSGLPGHGDYAYIANMQNARNDFQHEGITDPVYGETGRFFVSDPNDSTPTMTVTLTGLTHNQFYEYSFWAANAEPSQSSPNNNIDIVINGETVFSTGTLPAVESALAWKKYTFTFTNGPTDTVVIDLKSTETGAGGNDFNLDNIELRECNFAIDFGDLPTSYGDAIHTTIPSSPTIYLGTTPPDSETETSLGGDAGAGADGDDTLGTDDEDSYISLPSIPDSGTYTLNNIPVTNISGETATLHAWIDFDQDGKFSTGEYQSTTVNSGETSANLSWSIPGSISSGITYARFRITQNELIEDDALTTDIDERSKDAVINGEVEDYQVVLTPPAGTNPNVLLVKRITAINGQTTNPNDGTDLTQFVDDTSSSYQTQDNEFGWPSNFLLGEMDAGLVKPGDTVEYTIYFLSSGDAAAEDVRICDRIQAGQTFQYGSYDSGNADLQLQLGTDPVMNLTASNDSGDRAEFIDNGISPINCNLQGSNDNGVLVLDITGTGNANQTDLTNLPRTTGTGTPNNSFGSIKFQTTVD